MPRTRTRPTTGSRERQRQVMLAALGEEHRTCRLDDETLRQRYRDIDHACKDEVADAHVFNARKANE